MANLSIVKNRTEESIEALFRKKVKGDSKVKNAYMLVHSEKAGIHINLAEGSTGDFKSIPQQPNYMASVGKLFTSTIISMLHEQGVLSFSDKISQYLDHALVDKLHVYKGTDYSEDIQIRHLLNQSSGLPDNFYPLLEKLLADPNFTISPHEAVEWAKQNLSPTSPPGKKTTYTDTNYHLLGLIIENVRDEPFPDVLKNMIFTPLEMKHSYMLHSSGPMVSSPFPEADFYLDKIRLNDMKGFAGIDYAGGGVVAPLEDLLIFMKALVTHKLVSEETLETMKNDKGMLTPSFDYGYGIWQIRTIPLLLPEKYNSWGVLGATGAYMFYHPGLDTYLTGTFNHTSYQRKCVRFMLKIFNMLWKQQS